MKRISPDESIIEGQWVESGKNVVGDDACKRIEWLVSGILENKGADESGWETLYQDPKDKRFWILFYRHSERHGGGPPSLRVAIKDEIENKFSTGSIQNESPWDSC